MQADVIIIGGSFAGLSAALILARARRQVLVIDAGQPRNRASSHSHGVLGLDGIAGSELLKTARQQLLAYPGVHWINGEAVQAQAGPKGVQVRTDDGQVHAARKLLLATGILDTLPGIPGLVERWGRTVLHCPYCHGYEVGGGAIGVLGGPAWSAAKAALLADWGSITFFSQGMDISDEDLARLQQRKVQVDAVPVVAVEGEQPQWLEVVLEDGRRSAQRALFVPALQAMATPLVRELGCALVESPLGMLVDVDAARQTSVPGIYAAGDATVVGNITLASAEGVRAGIGMHQALVAEDSQGAVRMG
ncbi:NAD(P)/FAD-dependent oxidoreductase [Stenotrophomonas tumulicola]|uniref:NAD(P)/FAD-dependent oxidoreductase n=1 Tax=Stenotrophomonas tumulicola TaxID=1685415 RepID=A0A7W3FM94_9GAMM|nr:NAD(P)/FAD-dependent oxidoreductase [Stenotrophomonas tumulicola]MBA8682173.1 NAD(P)/FAD-dependent oxidoreductase [Stenotrophomonas tumulicola]